MRIHNSQEQLNVSRPNSLQLQSDRYPQDGHGHMHLSLSHWRLLSAMPLKLAHQLMAASSRGEADPVAADLALVSTATTLLTPGRISYSKQWCCRLQTIHIYLMILPINQGKPTSVRAHIAASLNQTLHLVP